MNQIQRGRARHAVRASDGLRKSSGQGISRATVLVFVLQFLGAVNVWAHNPYEITSTASVFTNSIEVQVEMEFQTALRLAGLEVTPSLPSAEVLIQARRAELLAAGGAFFKVFAGGNLLLPRSTNITLNVENHVQFQLEYPASHFRPLRFAADGLKPFEGQGPYGTTLTVLDRVNQKVLGQSVLYPSAAVGEFGRSTNANSDAIAPPIQVAPAQVPATNPAMIPDAAVQTRQFEMFSLSWFMLGGAIILFAVMFWRLRRRP